MRSESRLRGFYDEAVIDAPTKRADGEVTAIVIEQYAANTSGVVALPSRNYDIGLKIRPSGRASA